AILLAAGTGERLGFERAKAFVMLAGRPMLEWSLEAISRVPAVERVVVALPEGEAAPEGVHGVRGGASRSESVRAALDAAGPGNPVVVHDAARPLVGPELFESTLRELDASGCDGAIAAANAERYRAVASERGIEELGVSEHVYRFRQALDVWRHPFWAGQAVDDLDDYCGFVREQTDLRLGIEADFLPGREDRMANLLEAGDWDYVIGSVHFLRDQAVDTEDEWDVWRDARSPDQVWRRYFQTLGEAAA